MTPLLLFVGFGVLFGAFGSATAYIIFYREYIHHFAAARARGLAFRGALTAFLFFVMFSLLAGWVITRYVIPVGAGGP